MLEIKAIWELETRILLGLLEAWGHLTLSFLGRSCFHHLLEGHSPLNVSTPHELDYIPGPSNVSVAGGHYQDQNPVSHC